MAYDKLVDSAKLDGALKSTADAIRAKTGGTENIPWSETEGFKSAVEGITAGGGSGGSTSGDGRPFMIENVMRVAFRNSLTTPSGVEYYYNHEHLPEIPADVVENYQYIVIMKNLTYTRIYASKGVFYYTVTDAGVEKLYDNAPGTGVRYTYNADANAWVLDSVATGQFNFSMNGTGGSWVIWWSNHDIPNGSPDSEEIYWSASEAEAEQPADAMHFYFNGVRLPRIPADVLAEYPYAWIRNDEANGNYNLVFGKQPWYYSTNLYCGDDTSLPYYSIPISSYSTATEWTFTKDASGNFGIASNRTVLWSNHDIPNGSADATEIYFYGTHAVPDPM